LLLTTFIILLYRFFAIFPYRLATNF